MVKHYLPGTRRKKRRHIPKKINPFVWGFHYEEVNFYTRGCEDVVLLKGWYIPSQASKKCVIIVHGLNTNRVQIEANVPDIIKHLAKHGFNILTFDLRGHGESGGDHISLGYFESYDLLGARDFLINKKNIAPQNIGLLGFSYGAMTAILAAGKDKFGGVIVDSCTGDTLELTKRWMRRLYIPGFFLHFVKWFSRRYYGIDASELETKKIIKKIATPMFFIHGEEDKAFPYTEVKELYEVKKRHPLDKIWIEEGLPHFGIYKAYPEEYLREMVDFFKKTLSN